jgi:hypothetical protein
MSKLTEILAAVIDVFRALTFPPPHGSYQSNEQKTWKLSDSGMKWAMETSLSDAEFVQVNVCLLNNKGVLVAINSNPHLALVTIERHTHSVKMDLDPSYIVFKNTTAGDMEVSKIVIVHKARRILEMALAPPYEIGSGYNLTVAIAAEGLMDIGVTES